MVSLAKELAESGKDQFRRLPKTDVPQYNRPDANVVAYQILESFDHLGEDFNEARRVQRPHTMPDDLAVLSASRLNSLIDYIRKLKKGNLLARTRLHQMMQFLRRTPLPQADDHDWRPYETLLERIAETSGNKEKAAEVLSKPFGAPLLIPRAEHEKCDAAMKAEQTVATWYHVAELWDYFGSCELPAEKSIRGSSDAAPDDFAAGLDEGADQ